MQIIFRARGQRERKWQRPGGLDRRSHALDRMFDVVDRIAGAARGVLDRSADDAGGGGKANRFGNGVRIVTVTVFEIGIDR